MKVSLETIKEVGEEFKSFGFKTFEEHFRKTNPILLDIISVLDDDKISKFFLVILRIIEREAEKKRKKLSRIDPKVAQHTIEELLEHLKEKNGSEFRKNFRNTLNETPSLFYLLKEFTEKEYRSEQGVIFSLAFQLLKIIEAQSEVEELKKMWRE